MWNKKKFTFVIKQRAPQKPKRALDSDYQCIEEILFRQLNAKKPYPFVQLDSNISDDDSAFYMSLAHFSASHNDVLMHAIDETFNISAEEIDAAFELLKAHLITHQFIIKKATTPHFYITGKNLSFDTLSFYEINNRSLFHHMPKGKDAAFIHTLLTEIQLLLYQAPFNQKRVAQKLPLINAVWFWGKGELILQKPPLVISDDKQVLALMKKNEKRQLAFEDVNALVNIDNKQSETGTLFYITKPSPSVIKQLKKISRFYKSQWFWIDCYYEKKPVFWPF